MRTLRRTRPSLCILLYPPTQPGIAGLLLGCGGAWSIRAKLQLNRGDERQLLRADLRALLALVPSAGLRTVTELLTQRFPLVVRRLFDLALAHLEEGRSATDLSVKTLTERLGISARSLQRVCLHAKLPGPKRLCLWVLLLYVEFAAQSSRERPVAIAQSLGLDSKALQDLRTRLVGGYKFEELADEDNLAEVVLAGFGRACRLTASEVTCALSRLRTG